MNRKGYKQTIGSELEELNELEDIGSELED